MESFAKADDRQTNTYSTLCIFARSLGKDYNTDIYPTQCNWFQCIYGLTWSSGDLRLRSAKASPSCLCVCIIWDSWVASVWASLITCWYFLLLSRRISIWASSSMSTVLEPRPNLSDRICLVHCRTAGLLTHTQTLIEFNKNQDRGRTNHGQRRLLYKCWCSTFSQGPVFQWLGSLSHLKGPPLHSVAVCLDN